MSDIDIKAELVAVESKSDLPELKNKIEFMAFIIRAVNSMQDLDSVLRVLMDGAITLVGAERGFILFKDDDESLDFRVARGVERSELSKENFQVSRTLVSEVMETGKPTMIDNASSQMATVSTVLFDLRSIMVSPLSIDGETVGVVYLDNPYRRGAFSSSHLELLSVLAAQAAVALSQAALQDERSRLKGFLDRYVSPQVATALVQSNSDSPVLAGRAADVTILFADISGFTPLAEMLEPSEVMKLLNQHFTHMVEAIFAHDGTVKQFAGDEIMAIFGAPVEFDDHPARAVRAALLMQEVNQAWQLRRQEAGEPTFGLKIGLHCGPVVVGSVGSHDRMEYAAVGDVVNTASRIMNLSSRYHRPTCILASQEVVDRSETAAQTELLGTENLKGRLQTASVYALSALCP